MVTLSVEDHEKPGAVELHVRGGKTGDSATGGAEFHFSESSTAFTVMPAGYGPPPQTYDQLLASRDSSTVIASSGSASTRLSAHHQEPFGFAEVEVRTTEWAGQDFKKEGSSVTADLRAEGGMVELRGVPGVSPFHVSGGGGANCALGIANV